MGRPLKPREILLLGPVGLAGAMALVPTPAGPWAGAAIGGLVGLVGFASMAWAVRPTPVSPRILRPVETTSRGLGILGSATFALCVWSDHRGPFLLAGACSVFGGFFIASMAGMRLDHLKARTSSAAPLP